VAKRLGVLGAAIALVALAVGVVSPALGSSGDDDNGHTFRVTAILTEEQFVDVGDEGESVGDQFIFSDELLKDAKQVGHDAVVCTIVSLIVKRRSASPRWSRVVRLRRGRWLALQRRRQPCPSPEALGSTRGAEGEIHIRDVSETKSILTFKLEE
jgi:hypothetical protein